MLKGTAGAASLLDSARARRGRWAQPWHARRHMPVKRLTLVGAVLVATSCGWSQAQEARRSAEMACRLFATGVGDVEVNRLTAFDFAAGLGRDAAEEDAKWTDLADALDHVLASAAALGAGDKQPPEELDGYAAAVEVCSDLTGMEPLSPTQTG